MRRIDDVTSAEHLGKLGTKNAEIARVKERIRELEKGGDELVMIAGHDRVCGLRHGSHCTCAVVAWERLMGRRA